MNRQELWNIRSRWLHHNLEYECSYWRDFDYSILDEIMFLKRRASKGKAGRSLADVIIMADTETSKVKENEWHIESDKVFGTKIKKYTPVENFVCAWTVSIRCFGMNLCTLYGAKPSEMASCFRMIRQSIKADDVIFFWHNMGYDWVFTRQFFFKEFGEPTNQLNTKSHYPIIINFGNGISFRDTLILSQRKLEKWADDMDVEHKKAVGKWDYSKVRSQDMAFASDPDELEYVEHDTLAGVECIQKLIDNLGCNLLEMPYTMTGIPRADVRKIGRENNARKEYCKVVLSYYENNVFQKGYHGGFTHGNRFFIDQLINEELFGTVQCFDFASSYPYCLLAYKYPKKFRKLLSDTTIQDILHDSDQYAFMFKLTMTDVSLRDHFTPMPVLQFSKAEKIINPVLDNGRVLSCDYIEIYLTNVDLEIIADQYTCERQLVSDVYYAEMDYLPRWFTDYVYKCFYEKCTLKGGDPVLYALAKARLNSLYGMCVQRVTKQIIEEIYETGEYQPLAEDMEEKYEEAIKKRTAILPYQWGVWCTAYAMRNLFSLGSCARPVQMTENGYTSAWIYSDTDSCYSFDWDYGKIEAYNESCKDRLRKNGYGPVVIKDREFWLGVAEHKAGEDDYSEFKYEGAKRYCGRCKEDGALHITVAGVPKKGAACLNDDINNFAPGFVFDGETTGKLMHSYIFKEMRIVNGIEMADSIDLTPCSYVLDRADTVRWENVEETEVTIEDYE